MKSLLAFLTGGSLATVALSDSLAMRCIAGFLALYSGFTWARFGKLEGCGGSCGQGRLVCDCQRSADG